MGEVPVAEKDFRRLLEKKDVDAITIATPDHWHAPMAIAGLQAGKHVYLEKPCSHNPAEGVMLVEAQRRYGKLVQMGNQQRSSPHTIEIVTKSREASRQALAGESLVYQCKEVDWHGKEVPVPPQLIGTCGRGLCRAAHIGTICILITGTGFGSMGPVNLSTTARMKLMSVAGRLASITRNA